jgi:hypothetical protein
MVSSAQPVVYQVLSSSSSPSWSPVAQPIGLQALPTSHQSVQPALLQVSQPQALPATMQWQLDQPSSHVPTSLPLAHPHMCQLVPSDAQPQQQQAHQLTTVFFAGVTPVADTQRLRLLFAQFGRVMDLNLFRPYNGCRTSKVGACAPTAGASTCCTSQQLPACRPACCAPFHVCTGARSHFLSCLLCFTPLAQGCGLVVFSQHSEAAAALEALNGRFVWPGARSPMVIEWCDPNKQHKKKRAQPLAHTLMVQHPAHMQPTMQYVQMPLQQQQQQPMFLQQQQQQLPQPHQSQQVFLQAAGPVPMVGHELVQVVYVNQHAV